MRTLILLSFLIGFNAHAEDMQLLQNYKAAKAAFSRVATGIQVDDLLGAWKGLCIFKDDSNDANIHQKSVILVSKYFNSQLMGRKFLFATNLISWYNKPDGTKGEVTAQDIVHVNSRNKLYTNSQGVKTYSYFDLKFSNYVAYITPSGELLSIDLTAIQAAGDKFYDDYKTEFRELSAGNLMTKISTTQGNFRATGFCSWYEKMAGKEQLDPNERAP